MFELLKKTILIILVILSSISSFATVQEPDLVWYKGKLLIINNKDGFEIDGLSYPLSSCQLKMNWSGNNSGSNTANFRGYIATWEIRNDSLFLVKMQNSDFKEIPLIMLFHEVDIKNGLFASWYNGYFNAIEENSFLTFDKEVKARGLILMAVFKNGVIIEKNEPQLKKISVK